MMNVTEMKGRLKAAGAILDSGTTTIEKVRALKPLLSGVSPTFDKLLQDTDHVLGTLESATSGEVIDLAVQNLPEVTEEDRRRKKALALLWKWWGDLRAEVARVSGEMENHKQGSQSGVSMWKKIFSATKGPLAVITLIAVGIAAMSATSVDIAIENVGCGTLYADTGVPINLPGLVLPSQPIKSGETATATIPPLTITIDGSVPDSLSLSSLALHYTIQLSPSVQSVTMDDISLLGKVTEIKLSDADTHSLRLVCK